MKTLFKAFGIFCLLGIAYSILQTTLALTVPQWTLNHRPICLAIPILDSSLRTFSLLGNTCH